MQPITRPTIPPLESCPLDVATSSRSTRAATVFRRSLHLSAEMKRENHHGRPARGKWSAFSTAKLKNAIVAGKSRIRTRQSFHEYSEASQTSRCLLPHPNVDDSQLIYTARSSMADFLKIKCQWRKACMQKGPTDLTYDSLCNMSRIGCLYGKRNAFFDFLGSHLS